MSISFSELVVELKREYTERLDGYYEDSSFGRALLVMGVEREIDELSHSELLLELARIEQELLKEKNKNEGN